MVCNNSAANQSYNMGLFEFLNDMRLNVMSFDFRGFGDSDGSPTESSTYADARGVWDYLTINKGVAANKILLYGQGVGGAVAAHLAAEVLPAGLIVASGFESLESVLVGQYDKYPAMLIKLLCRYEYDNTKTIGAVSCPKLFFHSEHDARIPIHCGAALFNLANEPKRFVITQGHYGDEIYASRQLVRTEWRIFINATLDNSEPQP